MSGTARPRLLDLFCGAGGASMGYHQAGFEVVGVDIEPQPRYPFEFHQADAITFPLDGFDVLAGSPPCNDHSSLSTVVGCHGTAWMLAATVGRFRDAGLPYVVENVDRADLPGELVLCGTQFGLRSGGRWLKRHRRFASNVFLLAPGPCTCSGRPIGGVYGTGGRQTTGGRYKFSRAERPVAMGIDWMSHAELAQAIPPAYTQFVGEQLIASLVDRAVA
jgi:DNA (cytosine-5)-methyltransferase 1